MEICRGWAKRPIQMSGRQTYQPEELLRRALPGSAPVSPLVCQPVWVVLEGRSVRLYCREEIELACRLACIQHNARVGSDGEATTEEEESGEDTEEEEETEEYSV
jgi:hypothetical protein